MQPSLFEPEAQVSAPFQGKTPIARTASRSGAQVQVTVWTAKQSAYLQVLRNAGALTDQDAATVLHWPLASVNSIRNGLMDSGKVQIVPDGIDVHAFVDAKGHVRETKRTRWKAA